MKALSMPMSRRALLCSVSAGLLAGLSIAGIAKAEPRNGPRTEYGSLSGSAYFFCVYNGGEQANVDFRVRASTEFVLTVLDSRGNTVIRADGRNYVSVYWYPQQTEGYTIVVENLRQRSVPYTIKFF